MRIARAAFAFSAILLALAAAPADARITRIEITKVEPAFGGQASSRSAPMSACSGARMARSTRAI